MTHYVGVGGAWKTKAAEWVGVGGAWKSVAAKWVGVGGAWKTIGLAVSVTPTIADQTTSISPTDAVASLTVANTGALTTTSDGSGNQTWTVAGAASSVDVRLSQTSLTGSGVMAGSALATWLNCGTTRTWTLTNTTNGVNASRFIGTLEFRDSFTQSVVASSTVTLDANTET